MKKILVVFGTRPEAIKMCPVIIELQKRYDVIVLNTGQHKDMLYNVLNLFGVKADYDLSIMKEGQNLFDITNNVLLGVYKILTKEQPDLVLVHGDTTTSFSSALAAFYQHIPIGHVEAGLRTYDAQSPYPEEYNRRAIDIMTSYYFAPTSLAKENLLKEGIKENKIWITGNTGIDALRYTVTIEYSHKELEWVKDNRLILITAHRRENLGIPMRNMFCAIKRVLQKFNDVKAIYPVHMNPKVRKIAEEVFIDVDNIHLIEPLDAVDFHNFMKRSYLILTDSGGIQEEAPALGKPVLVMRNKTERPEGVAAGTLKLVGTDENSIYSAFKILLENKEEYEKMSHASNPYGDGYSSERISNIIGELFNE